MIESKNEQGVYKPDAINTTLKDSSETSANPVPTPTLPKGGGAIRGIDEKFSANPVTGTGSLTIPIFTTPGRAGFYPKLALSYDSAAGNGAFGIGWKLSIPAVTRKTDKGLPRYQDASNSDIYILSEAEDLVPSFLLQGNAWLPEIVQGIEQGITYSIQRYHPRIEGVFARIEQWRNQQTGETHWRSTTKDNITSIYGKDATSRIADPADASHVFKWLLEESYDDKGNCIVYEYKQENRDAIDPTLPQEKNRLASPTGFAQLYLKRIKYGNKTPYQSDNWFFEVVFDYGEHNLANPTVNETGIWSCRPDAFSSFRAGFEIRTYRLCRRVLMFHLFQELGNTSSLVRSSDFQYNQNPLATYLTSATQTGYIPQPGPSGGYQTLSLPSLDMTYSTPVIDATVHSIDAESLKNLPVGLDGSHYQWVDLDSEGISGILTEQANAWFYKRNLGDAHFAAAKLVATKPSPSNLSSGQQQLMDLAGNGQKYLVQYTVPLTGFYEHQEDGSWGSFTPFSQMPNLDWNDPNLKFIDLDGDGYSDILISEQGVFTWYRSLSTAGFAPAEMVRQVFDEEKGPCLVFADAEQSIYMADMTGDGLTDLVRVRNGEICYWPNCGYGRFGAKVAMDAAPCFDSPDSFEQKRIRFADIDGSGTTDIIYLGRNTITCWLNQAGNSWSTGEQLANVPAANTLSSISVVDLLGTGTACILWSSSLPADSGQPMRYIDLMSGQKPHLLQTINNNMGKEITLQYAPSTTFYLQDQAAGAPWVTRLPFPVHVVERVETLNAVTQTTLVTTYSYHHGYYDGSEREFRGFGLVEQWDAESFAQYVSTASTPATQSIIEEDLYVPPVYTKTWFHTGAYLDRQNISQHFAHEYYAGDAQATLLPDTALPAGLTAQEEQEACRSLKGRLLRQEVYAQDNSALSATPYSVTEHTYAIRLIQPVLNNPHAVFYANEQEAIEFHYERQAADPRVSHHLTLAVDAFGNVTQSAAIAYPRRSPLYPEQAVLLVTYSEADFINPANASTFYRIGVPYETRNYEITGLVATANTPLAFSAVQTAIQGASEIAYEVAPTPNVVQKRLVEHSRIYYYKDDLSDTLPLGQVESHALLYQTLKEAFTPGLLTLAYGTRVNDTLLSNEGHYLSQDGVWWAPSGRSVYDPKQFYAPVQFIDPFDNISTITYDAYALLVIQTTDALQNTVQAINDYRTMLPVQITDPNNNRSGVLFDALGMLTAMALMGKDGQNEGDTLGDPTQRFEYNLFNWTQNQKPNFVHTYAREQHGAANPRWQETYSYSDGFGHEVMKKIQAEPGLAPQRAADGSLVRDAQGHPVLADTTPQMRWVGTGRTIYDNKNNPVKKYEPFFSSTFDYETEQDLVEWGVTPILHYDPPGRLVRTDNPNGTLSRVEFDAWQQITWDENDTVLESAWYAQRQALDPKNPANAPEIRAAQLTTAHAKTPTVAHLDVLGRTFLIIADNASAGQYQTHLKLDIQGNQLIVTDARGNQSMLNTFDMLKRKLYSQSNDAGERWELQNVAGHPMRAWNSRNFQRRYLYDALLRPTQLFVQQGSATEILAECAVYGESVTNAVALNLRGRAYQHYDGAGAVTNQHYDFKGNLLNTSRQLATAYQQQVDWSLLASLTDPQAIATAAAPLLESETYSTSTTYDALNRPTTLDTPDSSVIRPTYNEANLLEKLDVQIRGAATWTPFVTNIDSNARGQRELIEYANGSRTTYSYDPETFRLVNLTTTRTSDSVQLQALSYTYDPVGNIVEIDDNAQQTVYFQNTVVSPGAQYVYDALYRLLQANGREHSAQNVQPDQTDFVPMSLPNPNDSQTMQNYSEQYQYDAVGNILSMLHTINTPTPSTWTRHYAYATNSNRLQSTSVPGDPAAGPYSALYSYDAHGNMTQMPQLSQIQWDYKDQLQQANLGGGGTAYYTYDAGGQRVHKVVVSGSLIKERIYLGGYEIYRQRNGSGLTLERQTLHIMDDKRRIALVETKTVDPTSPPDLLVPVIRYQLDNHLGSASLELDTSAAVISYEEYYPYGGTSYLAGPSAAEVSLKRYRYTGKERDDEMGLYYYGARYYAAWLGRWVSADPKGMVDGPNLYAYARNNPLIHVDPTGTQCDPTMQSCIDPTAPTAHEKAELRSIPEEHLPAASAGSSSPGDQQPRDFFGRSYAGGPWQDVYTGALKLSYQLQKDMHDRGAVDHTSALQRYQNMQKEIMSALLDPTLPLQARLALHNAAYQLFGSGTIAGVADVQKIPSTALQGAVEGAALTGGLSFRGPTLNGLGGGVPEEAPTVSRSTMHAYSPEPSSNESIVIEGSGNAPKVSPNQSTVPLPNPGESPLAYGARVHQELPRISNETNPGAGGTFNVAPGLTGPDQANPTGMNANYGEMKSMWGRQSPMIRQAGNWGFDAQSGRYFFYDRSTGIVFEGIIQTEKFPSGRFRP